MADLVITSTSVKRGLGAVVGQGVAGGTILAGQDIYLDTVTRKYSPVDSDDASVDKRTLAGIALNGAALDQPVTFQTGGRIVIGAAVAIGTIYVASDTAGGIMPSADLEAGDYVSIIGIGVSATEILLSIVNSGVAHA